MYENLDPYDFECWCDELDPDGTTRFLERVKSTGIIENPRLHNFYVYLYRRSPYEKRLQHVKRWKNYLPNSEEIGCTLGGGTAVIDFEVLYGRYSGKKKRSKRAVLRFGDCYNQKKWDYERNKMLEKLNIAKKW